MVSLNFTTGKAQILGGSKEMTIRALRKRPIKVGDKLHLFSGLRTKNCQRFKETTCIYEKKVSWERIKGPPLSYDRRLCLAELDGFPNWHEMFMWFQEHYSPLYGKRFQIICWGEETKGKLERMFQKGGI